MHFFFFLRFDDFCLFSPPKFFIFFFSSRSSFHLRYGHIFIPRLLDDAAHRSFRGSNCAASPRGLTAGTSLHDDSTIVRYVEKQRPSAKKEEDQLKEREREKEREKRKRRRRRTDDRYGMHEVRFLRDCRGKGTRKTYLVSVIPEERSGRIQRPLQRSCVNKIIAQLMHDHRTK